MYTLNKTTLQYLWNNKALYKDNKNRTNVDCNWTWNKL